MITKERKIDGFTTIHCDKCGKYQKEKHEKFSELLFKNGWVTNSNAIKYKHKCLDCINYGTKDKKHIPAQIKLM